MRCPLWHEGERSRFRDAIDPKCADAWIDHPVKYNSVRLGRRRMKPLPDMRFHEILCKLCDRWHLPLLVARLCSFGSGKHARCDLARFVGGHFRLGAQ